jgi:hypothetical protein
MKKRELLVIESREGYVVAGRCSVCHRPFSTPLMVVVDASHDIVRQFDAHVCNEDVNQAAARIVRETTE